MIGHSICNLQYNSFTLQCVMKGCGGFWKMLQPAGIRANIWPKAHHSQPHHPATWIVPVSGYKISEAAYWADIMNVCFPGLLTPTELYGLIRPCSGTWICPSFPANSFCDFWHNNYSPQEVNPYYVPSTLILAWSVIPSIGADKAGVVTPCSKEKTEAQTHKSSWTGRKWGRQELDPGTSDH